MQDVSHIPRPAFVLGWLGVIPFAAFALLAVTGGVLPHGSAMSGLVLYGAIILSFMGGAQWGLSMVTGGSTLRTRLAISGLPALDAFGLWFLPAAGALLGLAAVFVALLLYDLATARAGAAPEWYPALRIHLT
ncbi:MAG: DUF3429 domain-containing protein, partial [Rhodomicrobium sp.]